MRSKEAWARWPMVGFAMATESHDVLVEGHHEREFVVFDTETTARNPGEARLVEVAAARVEFPSGRVVERFAELVQPRMRIPRDVIAVHGITDVMVARARTAAEVLPEFFAWCGDRPLVAHNAAYDRDVLRFDAKRNAVTYPALPVYCSLKVARAVLRKPTDVPSHSLGTLVAWAGAEAAGAHRAAADVEALVVVLREILRRSGRSIEELHGEPSRL